MGGWLAEKWNLPPALVEAIAYHHHPFAGGHPGDAVILFVHMGNALCRHLQIGCSGDRQGPQIDPESARKFKRGQEIADGELLSRLSVGLKKELENAQIFKDLGEG